MNIDPYILIFSAVTVFATIFMGFWSAKKSKTASDFFVAGRSVSVGWNASAISGEYLSAASFMGIAGMVMSSGYDALWYPVCYACGYLFLLLFIAGPLRRFGAYTIPDFAEGRYDSPLFRKIAVCFVLFIGFFYTMPQMKGAGVTLAYIFPGLPYWVGVLLVGAVITLNVALGGMKGITLVQAFQYWAKMFAISVPVFVLMAVYGHYGKQLEVNRAIPASNAAQSDSGKAQVNTAWISPINHSGPVTTQEITVSTSVSMTASNGWVTLDARNSFDHLQERVASLFGQGQSYYMVSDAKMISVLMQYNQISGERIIIHTNVGLTRMLGPYTLYRTNWNDTIAQIETILKKNGVTLIRDNGAILAVTSEMAAGYDNQQTIAARKPLPEKAPADSTWLSPFGPLTTKAAKAAKPTLVYDGPWKTSRVMNASSTVNLETAKDKVMGVNTSLGSTGTISATLLAMNYAYFNARAQMLNFESDLFLRYTTNVQAAEISYDGLPLMRHDLVAESIAQTLKSNGITVIRDDPTHYQAFKVNEAKWVPVDPRPYALLYTYSLIIALVCGTAGLPHILVRFYTNPDGGAAKRTTMWVMILIGIFYVFPPVFGVLGRNLMPELYNGLTGVKGTDGIVLKLPTILAEKYGALGSILSGVTCAGAFAAFMSTFSGLLVSMTGALAHDVYGRMLRPKSTSEQRLRAFKIAAVLIGGVAIVLGCFVEPLEINFMVGQAFAIAAASYFPLLFMSVWWRGMTMKGAAVGMLTGGLCALFAVALTNVSNLALDKGPMGKIFAGFAPMNDFWAAHPLLRILCEQPAIWTVPLAIGLMVVVSKMTRRTVPSDVRMKMLVLHAPEKLGLKQEYIQEHQQGH